MEQFRVVKAYIDNIMVLIKDIFPKRIYQTIVIFDIIYKELLKFSSPKCSFWLKDIPYLGCIITQDGIKTDPKKVKFIMDIRNPTTTTEALSLVGMVQ